MNNRVSGTGWGFWIRWLVATAIAWVIGIIIAFPLSYLLNVIYPKTTNVLVGLCLGAAVGLAQKIAVRRSIELTWGWVWAAMIGMGLPFIVAEIIDVVWPGKYEYTGDRLFAWMLIIGTGGLITGLLQMRILRRFTTKASWWLPASIVSWGLAWLSMNLVGMTGYLVGGPVLGAVSGGLLLWILKAPVDTAAE